MKELTPIKNMMSVLSKRAFQTNKARNLVAILAIGLTTMMFTALFVLTQSMQKNMVEMAYLQTGHRAHASVKTITEEQVKAVAANEQVKSYGESIVLSLACNKNLAGRQLELRYGDDVYADFSFSLPTTGRMPENNTEVALDTIVLDRLGIPHELGQEITLEWKKDITDVQTIASTFTLCGFWEGNSNVYASMGWLSKEFVEQETKGQLPADGQILGLRMMAVELASSKHIQKTIDEITKGLGFTDVEFMENLAFDPSMQAMSAQETIPMYLGMVLVFAAGFLIIYNIFQISVTNEIRYYGQLKTLGTTKKQLKRLIYGQANYLCLIGIPIGLAVGFFLGMVLVPVLTGSFAKEAAVSTNPVIFVGAAVFAWLTVTLSCLKPAKMAARVSPIEALRYADTQNTKKKNKKGTNGATIPGMAFGNLLRNQKRTITVLCSLTLSLVLLTSFYAKNKSFDLTKYVSNLAVADFQIDDSTNEDYINGYDQYGTTISTALVDKIQALDGLTETGKLYSTEETLAMSEQTLSRLQNFYEFGPVNRVAEMEQLDPVWVEAYKQSVEDKQMGSVLYGVDGLALSEITKAENIIEGTFDEKRFAEGNSLLVVAPSVGEEIKKTESMPTPAIGERVEIGGKTYEIMGIVEPITPILEGASSFGFSFDFFMPAEAFEKQYPDHSLRKIFFNVKPEAVEAVETFLTDYQRETDNAMPYTSRKTMEEQYQSETRASGIIGNAISVVIGLVGILNFINSMTTSIIARKKEFAMIQSVGMTKNQLRNMLMTEGLYYVGITLLASTILSIISVGVFVRAMVEGGFTTFQFTLAPLVVCTPILLILAVMVPYFCFRNLGKQSIVERLRNTD